MRPVGPEDLISYFTEVLEGEQKEDGRKELGKETNLERDKFRDSRIMKPNQGKPKEVQDTNINFHK